MIGSRLITALILLVGCRGETPVVRITMEYPHGETRLTVNRGGEATLWYGALPRHEIVRQATFEVDVLLDSLRPHLHANVPREDWPEPRATAGMVTVSHASGLEETWLIFNQHPLAERIFNRARANVVGRMPPDSLRGVAAEGIEVSVQSDDWDLIGDLVLPGGSSQSAAVLMLNKADGDRNPYRRLAHELVRRGIASLRLDLRGHGESTNLGRFVPGERPRDPLIWDAETDVAAAIDWLRARDTIDPERIGVVGASYSGEEMAEAGRMGTRAAAYVALSPGSFSAESIAWVDSSGVPWLFVSARDDRYVQEITAQIRWQSRAAELFSISGSEHATDLLLAHDDLAEKLAEWLGDHLR